MSKTLHEYNAAREALSKLATVRESVRNGVCYCSISVYFGDAERAQEELIAWAKVATAHRLSVGYMAFDQMGFGRDYELTMQVTRHDGETCDTVAEAAGVGGPG